MISRCCCDSVPCQGENCDQVHADCCTTGLRPFILNVSASMNATTCSRLETDIHQCTAPNCTSWGSIWCNGCQPCLGPGTGCPCPDQECQKPAGRQLPITTCTKGTAGAIEKCRYGHLDFWYELFDPGGNGPCDVPTGNPNCYPGATCRWGIVHVPAGYNEVQCVSVSATAALDIDRIYNCDSIGNMALPVPNCDGPRIYGWPLDCIVPPPEGCECVCSCEIGSFGTYEIANEVIEGCNTKAASVTVTFAVPCADQAGVTLCGYGCDDCPSSYIGLFVQMTTSRSVEGVYGDPEFFEQTEDLDLVCQSIGIQNPPEEGPCDAGSQFVSALCADKCCECSRQWYVVLRRRRTQADGNLCEMSKGKYEIVGTSPCGSGRPYYACNSEGEFGETPCINAVASCSNPAAWEDYFAKLGLNIEVEIA